MLHLENFPFVFREENDEIIIPVDVLPKKAVLPSYKVDIACFNGCGQGAIVENENEYVLSPCMCHPEAYTFVLRKNRDLIFNLTQHSLTPEQVDAGVYEPNSVLKQQIKQLLTFEEIPSPFEIKERAIKLTRIPLLLGFERVMIGGAPFLMGALETALQNRKIIPLYAFSRREVVEITDQDGSVSKKTVFRHLGFVSIK